MKKIRNICVVAHIDHGKSTLADRILQLCRPADAHKFKEQYLDSMPLEKEKGVTIKAHPVRLNYKGNLINLIDTPGHEDFAAETKVSVELSDLVIILVDASQGVQPQTIFNLKIAQQMNKKTLPVINKIDLGNTFNSEIVAYFKKEGIVAPPIGVSAKTGAGVAELMDTIVAVAEPQDTLPLSEIMEAKLSSGYVIDGYYDKYAGAYINVKMTAGAFKAKDKVYISGQGPLLIKKVGYLMPEQVTSDHISLGEIGYINFNLTDTKMLVAGAYVSSDKTQIGATKFAKIQQKVYCNFFANVDYTFADLEKDIQKFAANDNGFTYEVISVNTLGKGFRCGFLGAFHLTIVKERLVREHGAKFVTTEPSAAYRHKGQYFINPDDLSEKHKTVDLPFYKTVVSCHMDYLSNVAKYLQTVVDAKKIDEYYMSDFVHYVYEIPYREALTVLANKIKDLTKGMGYVLFEEIVYHTYPKCKLEFLVNNQKIDGVAFFETPSRAVALCKKFCEKLKNNIKRRQVLVVINGCVNNRKVAREEIKPYRKDVTVGKGGGDYSRKSKLLKKQALGKKKMRSQTTIQLNAFELASSLDKF